jgi:hypothetical protein
VEKDEEFCFVDDELYNGVAVDDEHFCNVDIC